MKKYIIFLSIIFTSCSIVKIEEQIVTDFFIEKKLRNIPHLNQSFLINEASSYKNPLEYYEKAFENKSLDIGDQKFSTVPQKNNYWPINLDEIKVLKHKIKKDSLGYYWKTKNFKSLEVPIITKKELLDKAKNGQIPIGSIGHIISKPILSINKKYAFLTYSGVFCTGGIPEEMVLMELKNKNWKIITRFYMNL
ncbi:hypothetical protein [Flavobacterium sp. UMI-01]|uniref:hypothetical protein n=1 Tax=Flavobacterium sp. UMI-01 TaxID=1441053 RepID=UPI001C7D974F|nr:hypothetical protein [Flavobacterium sp. UMI-01]GIZ09482.1 hypothetical protein FUMI01_22090 [Flavobacterium sp. UMI-01]